VPCVAAARPSRPSRWAQTETPGYPGRKRESPRWCAVRSRIVHCARLTACIATLATAAKALVAARAAGWPLPAPLRCMEGDSEPIATAFHGCRSEAGADRARGRVVLVPSERVMPEPGDLLDVGEEKRSFGAEHVRVRCGYPRCFVPGVCDDPRSLAGGRGSADAGGAPIVMSATAVAKNLRERIAANAPAPRQRGDWKRLGNR
jgi:hypothetical protein